MKNIVKTFILLIIVLLITEITYLYTHPKIAVLCYHNIATTQEKENFPEESDWTITVDNFKEHLDYLKKHNYKTLTMEEFYKWKNNEIDLPYKSVLITFDDGFLSNYHYAFDLLKDYNMNATVFIVGKFIENSTSSEWNGNIKTYMTKDIILKTKEEYPNIELYSHSYNLHYQGAIEQNEADLEYDLQKYNAIYGNTNIYCYPFGQYNEKMENALKNYGYKLAFKYGPNKNDYKKSSRKDNNYEIPRLNASHGINIFKFGMRLILYN